MEREKGFMKRFFGEFKKFITRGNVLDMSVGIVAVRLQQLSMGLVILF